MVAAAGLLALAGGCGTSEPTAEGVCGTYWDWIDVTATGTRSEAELRNDVTPILDAADSIPELTEPAQEVMVGLTYYVDGAAGADRRLEAGMRTFSAACTDLGYP